MENKNIYEPIFEKSCAVCGSKCMTDIYGQGDCSHCNWYNNRLCEENENKVIFPNLISLNKARNLYKESKPFKPDLNDFIEGFDMYGEMEFRYKNFDCFLFRGNLEDEIEFGWSPENIYYFSNKEDFIKNAKIENEYVRDIWDLVENPKYM